MSNPQAEYETDQVGSTTEFGLHNEAEPTLQMNQGTPTVEEIAREAYALYVANGSQDGHALEHWLEAERRLMAQREPSATLQHGADVQHGNGESRERSARPVADRRRTSRPSVPTYLPV